MFIKCMVDDFMKDWISWKLVMFLILKCNLYMIKLRWINVYWYVFFKLYLGFYSKLLNYWNNEFMDCV